MMNLLPISQAARDSISAFSNAPAIWLQKAVCQLISPKNRLSKITAIFSLIVLVAIVYYRDSLFGQPLNKESKPTPTGSKFFPFSPIRRVSSLPNIICSDHFGLGQAKRKSDSPSHISSSSNPVPPGIIDGSSSISVRQEVNPELIADAEGAVDEMEKILGDIRSNFSLINEDPGAKLERLYREFAVKGGRYTSSENEIISITKRANRVYEQFVNLKSMYEIYFESLKNAEKQERIGSNGIIRQIGDGNCWLYSIIEGLRRLGYSQIPNHQTLREQVVEWMRNNLDDPTLLSYLHDRIVDGERLPGAITFHKEQKKILLPQELESEKTKAEIYAEEERWVELEQTQNKISELEGQLSRLETFGLEDYLADMQKDGCHGSGAELFAAAQLLGVDFTTYRYLGGNHFSPNFDLPIRCKNPIGEICVALNHRGDHFDFYARQEVTSSGLLAACAAHEDSSSNSSSSSSSGSSSSSSQQ